MGSEEGIRPANKKQRLKSLALTGPAVIVDVKQDFVVVEEVDESGFELSFAEKEADKALKRAMKSFCLVYNVPCQGCWRPWSSPAGLYLRDCKQHSATHHIILEDCRSLRLGTRSAKSSRYVSHCGDAFGRDGCYSAWTPVLLCSAVQDVV